VQGFLQGKRQQILAAWAKSSDIDIDGRERLYALNKILDDFEQSFKGYIANGEFASRELEAIEQQEAVNTNRTLANLAGQ